MKRSLLPFLPHAVIAIAYASWALGGMPESRMLTWMAIGHGLAPPWAGLIAIPAAPWRAYGACVGTILAGHVAAIVVLVGHMQWRLALGWAIATIAYAGFSAAAFALVVRGRRASR